MKWMSLLVVSVLTVVLSCFPVFAEKQQNVIIESIRFEKNNAAEESIYFTFSDDPQVKIFSIQGENPRLVVDILDSSYKGKNNQLFPDGILTTGIRIGRHTTPHAKIRVVVDLSKIEPVDYKYELVEGTQLLKIQLSSLSPLEASLPAPVEVAAVSEPEEDAIEEVKEIAVQSSLEQFQNTVSQSEEIAEPVKPQLFTIRFDDSSNKGEMVLFHLSDFHPPLVSAVGKENPRIICEFNDITLGEEIVDNFTADGVYVKGVSVEKIDNSKKFRVVVQLDRNKDYDLQQVFFKNDNLFVLIVNELFAENLPITN
jgi:hypothetical protein